MMKFITSVLLHGLILTGVLGDDVPTTTATASTTSGIQADSTSTTLTSSATTTNATTSLPTTASACEDDPAVNCTKLKPQCLDHRYDDLMNEHCRKTCNRCDVVVGTTTVACFDASTECESWNKNGYCNNTFYPESEKKLYCAKTCALC